MYFWRQVFLFLGNSLVVHPPTKKPVVHNMYVVLGVMLPVEYHTSGCDTRHGQVIGLYTKKEIMINYSGLLTPSKLQYDLLRVMILESRKSENSCSWKSATQ